MTKQPIYDNGFNDKVEQMVKEGLIVRQQNAEGIMVYALTKKGLIQWQMELLHKGGVFR